MSYAFPLYMDLTGNNCVVIGGDAFAAACAVTLLQFGAKVTVISPRLCPEMRVLDEKKAIRYIPRRYSRGDCTCACLCVAATETESVNIAISDECKAKRIPVNVVKPAAFGTFDFPTVLFHENLCISIAGKNDPVAAKQARDTLEKKLPSLLEPSAK